LATFELIEIATICFGIFEKSLAKFGFTILEFEFDQLLVGYCVFGSLVFVTQVYLIGAETKLAGQKLID